PAPVAVFLLALVERPAHGLAAPRRAGLVDLARRDRPRRRLPAPLGLLAALLVVAAGRLRARLAPRREALLVLADHVVARLVVVVPLALADLHVAARIPVARVAALVRRQRGGRGDARA